MTDDRLKLWFYIRKEMVDLLPVFSKVFDANNFERDYENVWEWMEGYSRKYKVTVNISREHDWTQGRYDKPIIILLNFDNLAVEPLSVIETITKELHDSMFVAISFGKLVITEDNSYYYLKLGVCGLT